MELVCELRVHRDAVRNPIPFLLFLRQKTLLDLLDGLVVVLAMPNDFADVLDQRLDISRADLVQVIEALAGALLGAPNPERLPKLRGRGLVLLGDVNVEERPRARRRLHSGGQVGRPFRGGAEDHISGRRLLQLLRDLLQRVVLEQRVVDPAHRVVALLRLRARRLLQLELRDRLVPRRLQLLPLARRQHLEALELQLQHLERDALPLGERHPPRAVAAVRRRQLPVVGEHALLDDRGQPTLQHEVQPPLLPAAAGLEAHEARGGEHVGAERARRLGGEQLEEPLARQPAVRAAKVGERVGQLGADVEESRQLVGRARRRLLEQVLGVPFELEEVQARHALRPHRLGDRRLLHLRRVLLVLGRVLGRHRAEAHEARVLVRLGVHSEPLEARRLPQLSRARRRHHLDEAGGVGPHAGAEQLLQPLAVDDVAVARRLLLQLAQQRRRLARAEARQELHDLRVMLVLERIEQIDPKPTDGVCHHGGEAALEFCLGQLADERVERQLRQRDARRAHDVGDL
mmetsp:Transcript_28690/g.71450  ORF Transcript_28690/g.71450 Transcript_28690/m.71450 type:complete len:517 (+) Transcript_28690:422-1972(+)